MTQAECHRLRQAGFTEFFTSDRHFLETVVCLLEKLEGRSKDF
jgi:hypothetical protein